MVHSLLIWSRYHTTFFCWRIRPFFSSVLQVRIQLAPGSTGAVAVAGDIIRTEGFMSLYNGLSAGILRQAVYTTARLGLFSTFLDRLSGGQPKQATFGQRAAAGLSAGVRRHRSRNCVEAAAARWTQTSSSEQAAAALVGNPADLALIR